MTEKLVTDAAVIHEVTEFGRAIELHAEPPTIETVLWEVRKLQDTLTEILGKFNEIADQVSPMIEQVSKHPMLKMLGVKL